MIRWTISILITVCVLIIISVAFLFTPIGLKITLSVAKKFVPGSLTYKRISGPLIGPIKVTRLAYHYKKTYIYIKKLHFQWQPIRLLQSRLDIKKLDATDVKLVLPSKGNQAPRSLPSFVLPIKLHIGKAIIHDLKVGQSKKHYPVQVNLLTLKGDIAANELKMDVNTDIKTPYAANIHLTTNGTIKNYDLKLTAKSHDINWTLYGKGGQQWIHFTSHEAHILDGSLDADITFHWAPFYRWKINLNTDHLNLRKLHKDWPKKLSLKLVSKGRMAAQQVLFSLNTYLKTSGVLIQASGIHDRQWDMSWKISASQLSTLLANYAGSLHGMGTIKGNTRKPIFEGNLKGNNVTLFGYHIGEFNSRWNVDLNYHRTSHIEFKSQDIETRRIRLYKLNINAKGQPRTHQIKALITLGEASIGTTYIDLIANGQLMKNCWHGHLSRLDIRSKALDQWHLINAAQLQFSSTQITTTPICIRSPSARTCLQGGWHKTRAWQATLNASGINITPILALLKVNFRVKTPVNINVKAIGQNGKLNHATLTMKFKRGSFHSPKGMMNTRMQFTSSTMVATLDSTGLIANLQLNLSSHDVVSAKVLLPGYSIVKTLRSTQPIQGAININTSNLKIFQQLLPDIIQPKGKLLINLNLSGTISKPRVHGQIKLQQGSVQIPQLRLALTNITIDLNATGSTITYDVHAYSQNKLIQIKGKTQLDALGRPTHLKIQGDDILIINTVEYIVYATTALTVDIKGHQIHIGGIITIPRAILKPIAFNGIVTLPEDVVFVEPIAKKQSKWYVTTNIKIVIGDNVKVDSHGLTGRLTGHLAIAKTPVHTYIVNGNVGIKDGVFTTHGKTLVIEPGSIVTFTQSPLKNPNLSIRAIKDVNAMPQVGVQTTATGKITVGLDIEGTLRSPNVSLFSSPVSLSQADILSYLLFGHPANANTPSNVSFLIAAIDTLNLGGSKATPGGIGDQITQGLGLSEFGVESETTLDALGTPLGREQSAFVIGRYISPKIYIRYSRGLVTPINILQIRYLFNANWSIQTETSSLGEGVDTLYTIQKNK